MEGVGVAAVVQARQLALRQPEVVQGIVDKGFTERVFFIQVILIDHLIRPATDRRLNAGRRIGVTGDSVQRDGASAKDIDAPARIDGHIIGIQPGGIQFQGATGQAVVLPRATAQDRSRAVAHVDTRAIGQGQLTVTAVEFNHRPVRRIDDFAVAVDPQRRTVGIQHRTAGEGQTLLAGQADTADPLTTGVDSAHHRQTAVIHRDVDLIGLEFIADNQVALLELEAARTPHLPLVQALVQRGEIPHLLRTNVHPARLVRYQGATGIVIAAATGADLPLQVDLPCSGVHRHGFEQATLVVSGGQVDERTCGLINVAVAAFQADVTAPAVFAHVVVPHGATTEVQTRRSAQGQRFIGAESQLAAGQHHRRIDRHAAPGQQ